MNSKKADISQIRKYLNGELNAAAMHKLEREALDDPFLMDALEGYEGTSADQQNNLAELSGRLNTRIKQKQGRVISWRVWSIAASVLILLTIGGLWLRKEAPHTLKTERTVAVLADKTKTEQQNIKPQDTPAISKPIVEAALIVAQNKKKPAILKPDGRNAYQDELSEADHATPVSKNGYLANQPHSADADVNTDDTANTTSLNEAVVVGYTKNKKKTADTITLGSATKLNDVQQYSSVRMDSKLQGSVKGLNVVPSKNMKSQMELARITGIILSQNDKSPLIGAAIRIKGTNKSTVTDANGGFALSANAPGEKQTLDIAYIGYQNTQVNVKAGDSLKVELKPYGSSLSEVVVTRKRDNDEEPAIVAAHPDKGWGGLKKYLQANAILPDGTTGTVSVIFTVNTDGSKDDFLIKKSFNTIADQKAIDLLKNGPDWVASSTGKPETVTVKVKFQKQK